MLFSLVNSMLFRTFRIYSPVSSPYSLHNVMEGKSISVTGCELLPCINRTFLISKTITPYLRKALDNCGCWVIHPILNGCGDAKARTNKAGDGDDNPRQPLDHVLCCHEVGKAIQGCRFTIFDSNSFEYRGSILWFWHFDPTHSTTLCAPNPVLLSPGTWFSRFAVLIDFY